MGRRRLAVGMGFFLGIAGPDGGLEAQSDSTRRDSVRVLPSLTVTALRRHPNPFAVSAATTSITPSTWVGRRGYGLDDALWQVPGVLAQSRYGTSDIRLVIRGFGARGAGDRSN